MFFESLFFESIIVFPVTFIIAALSTYLLVPLVADWANKHDIVDLPSARRIHQTPIPRIGGVAVFLGFHLACNAYFLSPWNRLNAIFDTQTWIVFSLVSFWIFSIGLYDDLKGLKPKFKLAAQIFAAVCMFLADVSAQNILGFNLPLALDLVLSIAWFVLIINAFNLIDGMDGLASGLCMIAALGMLGSLLFRHLPGDAIIMTALFGACCAFLRFNFNPASIFLGDCGSTFLGFVLAAVALATSSKGTVLASVGVPLLAVGVPLFDTLLAIWRRSVRATLPAAPGQKPTGLMHFDTDHLHHRLLRSGRSQRNAAYTLYLVNIALVMLGLLSLAFSAQAWGFFVIAFVIGSYIIARHVAYVELWDSGVALLHGFRAPSNPVLAVILYPVLDFCLFVLALLLATIVCEFSYGNGNVESAIRSGFFTIPVLCGTPFIILFASGTYSRVWSRAKIAEFFFLAIAVLAGIALAIALLSIAQSDARNMSLAELILYSTLAVAFTAGLRTIPSATLDVLSFVGKYARSNAIPSKHSIVYGAGYRGLLYLNIANRQAVARRTPSHILGFLDDDRNLRGRTVRGFKILGTLRELSKILAQNQVCEVILTAELSEKRLERLRRICRLHQVNLYEFRPVTHCLYSANQPAQATPHTQLTNLNSSNTETLKLAVH